MRRTTRQALPTAPDCGRLGEPSLPVSSVSWSFRCSFQVGLFSVRLGGTPRPTLRSRRGATLPPRGKSVCLAFYGQGGNSMPHSCAGFKREFQKRTKDKGLAFHAFQHPLSLCPQTAWPAYNPAWLHAPPRPSSCARCPVRRAWRYFAAKSTVICHLIY